MALSLHGDVASAIGQQVEQMIIQAKKDSESRVRHDLTVARSQLQHMESAIAELSERVKRCALASGSGAGQDPSEGVDKAFLQQKIAQLEQKWGSEVKALKQDLHRTILAHNHNSDLMRHHRDALDEARRKLDAQTQPKAEQVDAQIEKVDRMLRAGQSKQRALDALTDRLGVLEQQVGEVMPNPGLPAGFPSMMPGLAGMNPALLAQAAAAAAAAQTSAAAAPAAAPKQRKAKQAAEPPTEEEVRARLLQAARANSAADNAGIQFNAQAPVFVPRGAPKAKAEEEDEADAGEEAIDAEADAEEDDEPDA